MKTIPYSRFKHGQRVTCEIEGKKIDDAKIIIDSDGSIFICHKKKCGFITAAKFGYKYSFCIFADKDGVLNNRVTNLKFLPRTLDDIEEGDVVVDKYGDERKVLGACGEVYFLSRWDNFKKAIGDCCTLEEIKQAGYTPKQDEPEEEKPVYTTEYPAIFVSENEDKISYKGKTYILSK